MASRPVWRGQLRLALVSCRDLVKGYEFRKDHYLIVDDDDFESARIDSSSTLNVSKFVAAGAIDPIWHDTSYLLAPDGANGQDVYLVLREAITASGKVALSRVVTGRREREPEPDRGNVIDLMAALKQSLQQADAPATRKATRAARPAAAQKAPSKRTTPPRKAHARRRA